MRLDVTSWKEAHAEDRGVNKKVWLEVPGQEKQEALYKETQIKSNSESTYADFGEDIVSKLCSLLGVPCAQIDLVVRENRKGCISYNFLDPECDTNPEHYQELIDMGTVIQNARIGFNSKSMEDPERKEYYCVEMILEGLESIAKNKTNYAELRKEILKYILVDSIIDQYDRNPSNLSVIRDNNGVKLAPLYDNGTSLSISVPLQALEGFVIDHEDPEERQRVIREAVNSKIGYLGRKYVKYPDLETFIFNYYYDDVKDFVGEIQEKLTDENIDKILSKEEYDELTQTHKEIIRGKIIGNRNAMIERYNTISKKKVIDKIIYSKASSSNFSNHLNKGTIQEILPEYAACIDTPDSDQDYDLKLDEQVPAKIQNIVDISQLARYFGIPITELTKREKNLLKWTSIMENIRKANNDPEVFHKITERLGFLPEDKRVIDCVIRDKFKDENDLLEAREIIYGKEGIGEENVNMYLAKKFVDAATMKPEIREQRMAELRTFAGKMKESVELENILMNKQFVKVRYLQKNGVREPRDIAEIQYSVAQAYRDNPRITNSQIQEIVNNAIGNKMRDKTEEVRPGVFIDKEDAKTVREHTVELENGESLVLFTRNQKLNEIALKMGADYYAQIIEHPSGNGVTMSITTKKGGEFPESFKQYVQNEIISKYNTPDTPEGAFVFKDKTGEKSVSCFIVSAIAGKDAKIPDVTAEEMSKRVINLLNGKEIDKKRNDVGVTHLDD